MRFVFFAIFSTLISMFVSGCGRDVPVAVAEEVLEEVSMNRLADATSPYLLQHKTNPVDWYTWGEAAFAAARAENKPIFLSVGYSTCHWCHVMARESFSNPEIAAVMNRYFINIKVDREERPDVDQVYMAYVQATTGSGGWPMSVWLTPELKPFYGGTYFPPEDRYGRPGFPSVMQQIGEAWEKDAEGIRAAAGQAITQLRLLEASARSEALPEHDLTLEALKALRQRHDAVHGGFGDAPKFPTPAVHLFLQLKARRLTPPAGDEAAVMSINTLRAIVRGGIHDHVGGGFHRYAVDAAWRIPHYEKMLYDQAQLVPVLLGAWQLTHDSEFADAARNTLAYVMRDMTHPDGGFYSAEDAESLPRPDAPRKREGAFYVWTQEEIEELLGEDASGFIPAFGVKPNGNAPPETDHLGELAGTNTLRLTRAPTPEDAANLTRLRQARDARPRPHLDDKVLAGWNGMMISAFAQAYIALDDPAYLTAAERAAAFVEARLYNADSQLLYRSYRDGRAEVPGFASDYAHMIEGLLDLYQANFDPRWLAWADTLQTRMDALFLDTEAGGYFETTGTDPSILLRQKDGFDGAEPSANATAALNLIRLADLLDQPERRERAAGGFQAFGQHLMQLPTAAPKMMVALDAYYSKPRQAVIAGDPEAADTRAMLALVRRHAPPHQLVMLADGGAAQAQLASSNAFFEHLAPIDGKATLYLCEDFVCQLPVNTLEEAKTLLTESQSD